MFELDFTTVWHDPATGEDTPAIARIHTNHFMIAHEMKGFKEVCASWILIYFPRAYAVICSLRLDCYWTLAKIQEIINAGGRYSRI
jgi:hypothetical protein